MKLKIKFIIAWVLIIIIPIPTTILIFKNFISIKDSINKNNPSIERYLDEYGYYTQEILEKSDDFIKGNKSIEEFKKSLKKLEEESNANNYGMALYDKDNMIYKSNQLYDLSNVEIKSNFNFAKESEDINFAIIDSTYIILENYEIGIDNNKYRLIFVANISKIKRAIIEYIVIFIITLIGTFIIMFFLIMTWISKSISRPLNKMINFTTDIKKGNFDTKIDYSKKDEFKDLVENLESMRLELKKSLEREEKLKKDKKEMIENISHDLRTPITTIRGYIQGIKDGVVNDKDSIEEYLSIVQDKTYMIEELVKDLRLISDYDKKLIKNNKINISIKEFIDDFIEEVSYDMKNTDGVVLYKNLLVDESTKINMDIQSMRRVLLNIYENSKKYKSDKPLKFGVKLKEKKDLVIIQISDNGIGVKKEELNNIFKRFFRADKARNLNLKGSGIGLSICKEIVEENNGKISANKSEFGGLLIEIELKK